MFSTISRKARTGDGVWSSKRLLACLSAVALASAGLAIVPLSANAAEVDIAALQATATDARAAADQSLADAQAAAATSQAASATADEMRAASDSAAATSAAAAEALTVAPDDVSLQDAAASASVTAHGAENAALAAEADAAAARALAGSAAATATTNEAIAAEAEAALAAALDTENAVDGAPLIASQQSLQPDNKNSNRCDRNNAQSLNVQKSENHKCVPEPRIRIEITNICTTGVTITISELVQWGEYAVTVNGVVTPITAIRGRATITMNDVQPGKILVEVKYGKHDTIRENKWIKDATCPTPGAEIRQECATIDGSASVRLTVGDLDQRVRYVVTLTGPDGVVDSDHVWSQKWWKQDMSLAPGTYTLTVEGGSDAHPPTVGPVSDTFEVAPCPGRVTITITPTCAVSSSGSLGAMLADLVIGREYRVMVTSSGGVVTDVTFVAESTTYEVPPASLSSGSYTVKVVDVEGHGSGDSMTGDTNVTILSARRPHPGGGAWEARELSWSATGTVSSCPPARDPSSTPAALATTGANPGGASLAGLLLLPLGASLLASSAIRRRKTARE